MRLVLDARARRWLRRLPGVNLYSAGELALLAVLAAQSARLIWAIVTPVGPLGDWRPAQPVIPAEPAALLASFDPFFRVSGADANRPATVTSLQLKLFGTRMDEASGRGSAIVAGPDGVQKSVAIGEEVASGVVLKSVAFDHVSVSRGGGAPADLYLDQSGVSPPSPAIAAPGGAPPASLTDAPSPGAAAQPGAITVARLRSEIGFTPRLDGGRLTGLAVRPQGPAFAAAGLREGDVVTAIGGRPVTGANDLDPIARDYARGGILSITVERGGQPTPIAVMLAPGQ